MSDEKPSKPMGSDSTTDLITDTMQRIASVKTPRDLSLGASKSNRKVFVPNLNVVRNKNKGLSASSYQGSKKEGGQRKDRKNEKNKASRGPNIIKSSGVFSGASAADRQSSCSSDDTPSPQKPALKLKESGKINKEFEEKKKHSVLVKGLKEDGSSVDFNNTSERDAPIKLPMDHGIGNGNIASADIKREPGEQTDVAELLNRKEPTLILLQLPDTLPGRGGGRPEEPQRNGGTEEPSTSSVSSDDNAGERCYLSDLQDGRIGTLRTHRSGRVTLLLGETVFEVNMGTKPAYHQEVVSASFDDASRSASLVSLGSLQHQLSIVPQWETMFKDLMK